MNDLYSLIAGLLMHAYEMATFILVISIPGIMLLRAFRGRNPI